MPRLIAIGDIHGCDRAFAGVLEQVQPEPEDTLVLLGDYIDRGPNSRGVIERILQLKNKCHLVTLRGNHEQMLLDALDDRQNAGLWLMNGGIETLDSYASEAFENMPDEHIDFLRSTQRFYDTEDFFFIHANYDERTALEDQPDDIALWRHLDLAIPGPHNNGKTAVVGHTLTLDEVYDAGHLICLDTGCFAGGCLSAMELPSRRLWQVSEHEVGARASTDRA